MYCFSGGGTSHPFTCVGVAMHAPAGCAPRAARATARRRQAMQSGVAPRRQSPPLGAPGGALPEGFAPARRTPSRTSTAGLGAALAKPATVIPQRVRADLEQDWCKGSAAVAASAAAVPPQRATAGVGLARDGCQEALRVGCPCGPWAQRRVRARRTLRRAAARQERTCSIPGVAAARGTSAPHRAC
jgi:hypothetical protein